MIANDAIVKWLQNWVKSLQYKFMAKRPRDPAQLAKQIFDIAIGEADDTVSEGKRHPDPRRAGGLKGGRVRAERLDAEERRNIARKAAKKRWKR
jgi:hypothetical protein